MTHRPSHYSSLRDVTIRSSACLARMSNSLARSLNQARMCGKPRPFQLCLPSGAVAVPDSQGRLAEKWKSTTRPAVELKQQGQRTPSSSIWPYCAWWEPPSSAGVLPSLLVFSSVPWLLTSSILASSAPPTEGITSHLHSDLQNSRTVRRGPFVLFFSSLTARTLVPLQLGKKKKGRKKKSGCQAWPN